MDQNGGAETSDADNVEMLLDVENTEFTADEEYLQSQHSKSSEYLS